MGRPLKDVQARLRAMRAGKHPTTKLDMDNGEHTRIGTPAAVHPGRERSRSARRVHACRSMIAAINGEDPPPRVHTPGAVASSAVVRRGGRAPHPASVRQTALCRMLIAAATASEAAASRTHGGANNDVCVLWWIMMGLTTAAFAALFAMAVLWTQEEAQEETGISKTPHTRDVPGGTCMSTSSLMQAREATTIGHHATGDDDCRTPYARDASKVYQPNDNDIACTEGSLEAQFICVGAHGAMSASQDVRTIGATAVSLDPEQVEPYLGWSQVASFCLCRKGKAGEPHARASYTAQKRSYVASCARASQDSLLQCPAVGIGSCLEGHGHWLGRERHRPFRKVSSGPAVRRVQRSGWLRHAKEGVYWAWSPSRAARVALLDLGVLGGWLRQAQKGVYWALSPPSAAPSALLALESFGNSALGLLDRGALGRLAAAS